MSGVIWSLLLLPWLVVLAVVLFSRAALKIRTEIYRAKLEQQKATAEVRYRDERLKWIEAYAEAYAYCLHVTKERIPDEADVEAYNKYIGRLDFSCNLVSRMAHVLEQEKAERERN